MGGILVCSTGSEFQRFPKGQTLSGASPIDCLSSHFSSLTNAEVGRVVCPLAIRTVELLATGAVGTIISGYGARDRVTNDRARHGLSSDGRARERTIT